MQGIVSYGAYVPYHRLQRAAIAATLGGGAGRGTRAVAAFDEDATTLGVAAARSAMSASPLDPGMLLFATATPPYLDKTNATAIHAALGLDPAVVALDTGGALRSGVGSLLLGLRADTPALVVMADLRGGRPGSDEEAAGGDGAAAFVLGDGEDVIAELIGTASVTSEFLDRWRLPGETTSRMWEERFGEAAYAPLIDEAVTAAIKDAGVTTEDLDHVIAAGTHARALRRAQRLAPDALADDLTTTVGQCGTAHAGMGLAAVLDRAEPGQVIALVSLADGVDVLVLRTTDAIAGHTPARPVAAQIAAGRDDLDYARFLTWRGFLERQPPRRPDPVRPAAPPSLRGRDWKFGLTGSQDTTSGAVHLPPQRVSFKGGAVDEMTPVRRADAHATIATYTIDHLAYSMSPPTVVAVIDFDGGGRFVAEVADADPDEIAIGGRVEMTFRRRYTADGVHNYFWKATPIRPAGSGSEEH